MPLSSGCVIPCILVQYSLLRFCPLTKLLFISIGSTQSILVIISTRSFFILTFSNRKYLGFTSFSILTYSKKSLLLGSLKFNFLPALLNPWQGLPPIRRSILFKLPPPQFWLRPLFLQYRGGFWLLSV